MLENDSLFGKCYEMETPALGRGAYIRFSVSSMRGRGKAAIAVVHVADGTRQRLNLHALKAGIEQGLIVEIGVGPIYWNEPAPADQPRLNVCFPRWKDPNAAIVARYCR